MEGGSYERCCFIIIIFAVEIKIRNVTGFFERLLKRSRTCSGFWCYSKIDRYTEGEGAEIRQNRI